MVSESWKLANEMPLTLCAMIHNTSQYYNLEAWIVSSLNNCWKDFVLLALHHWLWCHFPSPINVGKELENNRNPHLLEQVRSGMAPAHGCELFWESWIWLFTPSLLALLQEIHFNAKTWIFKFLIITTVTTADVAGAHVMGFPVSWVQSNLAEMML